MDSGSRASNEPTGIEPIVQKLEHHVSDKSESPVAAKTTMSQHKPMEFYNQLAREHARKAEIFLKSQDTDNTSGG